jgi:hypothetical protein
MWQTRYALSRLVLRDEQATRPTDNDTILSTNELNQLCVLSAFTIVHYASRQQITLVSHSMYKSSTVGANTGLQSRNAT